MNNIPAFPIQIDHGAAGTETYAGMTLRDYFAIHATDKDVAPYLNDYGNMMYVPAVSNPMINLPDRICPTPRPREQARYIFADAMLKMREMK